MPSTLTHYLLAERVYSKLLENRDKYINLIAKFKGVDNKSDALFELPHKNLFWWGTQGPDYLFMVSLSPLQNQRFLKGYGSRLHRLPPSITFENIRNIIKLLNDDLCIFYSLGFICHYALDSIAHPLINYNSVLIQKELKYSTDKTAHALIETNLDNIILLQEKGLIPISIDINEILPINDEVKNTIAKLYVPLLKKLFGEANMSEMEFNETLKQVVERFKKALIVSRDETSLKKQFFRFLENRLHIPPYFSSYIRGFTEESNFDFANLKHNNWHWPLTSKKFHNDSFLDLFNKAQDNALYLIDGFLLGESMKKLTKDKPFV